MKDKEIVIRKIELQGEEIKEEEEIYEIQRRIIKKECSKIYTQEQIDLLLWFYSKEWVIPTLKTGLYDLYIAEKNSKIIGFGLVFINIKESHRFVPIALLDGPWLNPDYCRQGIGSNLLFALENVARERGCISIHGKTFLNFVSFSQKAGYNIEKGTFLHWKGITIDCFYTEKIF